MSSDCRFTLWLLKLWPHKQQPMKERESKVCCVLLHKLASGWWYLKQTWWPAVGRQGAKNSIAQLGFWKGIRWSDVRKPQMSLASPAAVQSVPTLSVGFRKMSFVCPDSKPMALCHNCVSRGFQGTSQYVTVFQDRLKSSLLCSSCFDSHKWDPGCSEKPREDSEKAPKVRKPFQYSPQTRWELAVQKQPL